MKLRVDAKEKQELKDIMGDIFYYTWDTFYFGEKWKNLTSKERNNLMIISFEKFN